MKCQFCQQRCVLQKPNDRYYQSTSFHWKCDRHPVEVNQIVYCQKFSLRGNYQQKGEIRHWANTMLTWVENGKMFRANFFRDTQEEPSQFVLETSRKKFSERNFDFDWALDLEGHPKDITPENIQTKMKTYLVFS